MTIRFLFLAMIGLFLSACEPAPDPDADPNPPAPGFNAEESDPEAISLADDVMKAMGGREAWDQTRFIGWNFFGRRHLLWDKHKERVRIDIPADSAVYLLDLKNKTGQFFFSGQEVSDSARLDTLVQQGTGIWINDSYWLVMPFKLKDSGVTLKYLGEKETPDDGSALAVELTFDSVGNTPDNKYNVYVDPETRRVIYWEYFPTRDRSVPGLSTPWQNYQTYGAIQLSGDRGDYQLSDIQVWDSVPEPLFRQPEKPEGFAF
jgi:hypothetical protein